MWLGKIVRSKCGRDRYRTFAVVGTCEDGSLLIADGNLHKLASPKKKNMRHIEVLAASDAAITSLQDLSDDRLCETLREFEKNYEKHN